jgi:hypothetical protein
MHCRYTFAGELVSQHTLSPSLTSVMALDVADTSGAIALGGTYGCVDVLSRYSTRLLSLQADAWLPHDAVFV